MYSKVGEIREKAKKLLSEKNFFTPIEIARELGTSRQYVHQAIDHELEVELGVEKKRGLGWIAHGYTGPLPTNRDLMTKTQKANNAKKFSADVDRLREKLDGCGQLSLEEVKAFYPGMSTDRCRRLMASLIDTGSAVRPAASYRQPENKGRLMNVVYSTKKANELIGGRTAEGTSKMALVRQHLLELKKSGKEFYVSALAHDIDVNNGLVLSEVRRLVRAGEIEFVGKVKSRRNSPQARNMFRFTAPAVAGSGSIDPEPEPTEPDTISPGPITQAADPIITEEVIELSTEG
jgi:Mn-dependent DtxR family transcriptional regulator